MLLLPAKQNGCITGYYKICGKLFPLSLLKIGFHFLLVSIEANEKSAVGLITFPTFSLQKCAVQYSNH